MIKIGIIVSVFIGIGVLCMEGGIWRKKVMPAFELMDQESRVVTEEALKEKVTVMNFIFTRCRNRKMCPSSTERMVKLQREIMKKGWEEKVQILTITFDPEYDKPRVLKRYGEAYGVDWGNYRFLTGDEGVTRMLKNAFKIYTVGEGGEMEHTMNTLLIDGEGTVVYGKVGHGWKVKDMIKEIDKRIKA